MGTSRMDIRAPMLSSWRMQYLWVPTSDVWELQHLHDQTHANALSWLRCHHPQRKEGIITHFGMMPPVEENYWLLPSGPTWLWWLLAILPLDSHAQTHILSQCLLKKRLSAVHHILSLISDN